MPKQIVTKQVIVAGPRTYVVVNVQVLTPTEAKEK